eukprot:6202199-Pleurochrysis_carterae.AAC.5
MDGKKVVDLKLNCCAVAAKSCKEVGRTLMSSSIDVVLVQPAVHDSLNKSCRLVGFQRYSFLRMSTQQQQIPPLIKA